MPQQPNLPRIYGDLAELWPKLSPLNDHAAEAELVREIFCELRPHLIAPPTTRPTLLELGSGAGQTLFHLAQTFDGTAVDLSPQMLEISSRLNPKIKHHEGDLRTVTLDQLFHAVLLLDSADYLTTLEDIKLGLQNAARHLLPDGLLLIAPTYLEEKFDDGQTEMDAKVDADGHLRWSYVSHVHRSAPDHFILRMTITYRDEEGLQVVEDQHDCGLFSTSEWLQVIRDAGLEPVDLPLVPDQPFHLFGAQARQ